ncbi:hypothetical protein OC188_03620 [Anaplasma capra]|nr:hypothetical protein [Anaplasma capra]
MYEGDCKHVYPSSVMVYSVHDAQGPEQICACKAKSCYLPWNSTEWEKNCYQQLGCFNKTIAESTGPFCSFLPSRHRPMNVRFVPMEFSKQSFWNPGFVAITEHWEYEDGAMRKKINKHIIHPGGKQPVSTQAQGGSGSSKEQNGAASKYSWHTTGDAIDEQERPYEFSEGNVRHHLRARRVRDTVCVAYYGEDQNRKSALFGSCVPIPKMELPVVYRAYRSINDRNSAGGNVDVTWRTDKTPAYFAGSYNNSTSDIRYSTGRSGALVCPIAIAIAKNYGKIAKFQSNNTQGDYRVNFYWSKSSDYGAQILGICDGALVGHFDTGTQRLLHSAINCDHNLGQGKIIPIYSFGVEDTQNKQQWRMAWTEQESDVDTLFKYINDDIHAGSTLCDKSKRRSEPESRCYAIAKTCTFGYKRCVKFNGTTCYREEVQHGGWSKKHYDKPQNMFEGYATKQFAGNTVAESGSTGRTGAYNAELFGVFADPKSRELHKSCVDTEDEDGKICRYDTRAIPGSNVLCIAGTGSDVPEYEIRSKNDGGISRTWLKRKPKALRRYVLVDVDGNTRRVACDDKYSILLDSLSQAALDGTTIQQDGQYVLPRELLEQSFVKGSSDPCANPNHKIAYYYESGGFTDDPGVLSRCSHPVTQYYGPGKEVKGCAYEYVSMDDYRPLTFSERASELGAPAATNSNSVDEPSVSISTNGTVEHKATALTLKPLSPYDRGLCIDNFPRHWYEPRYMFNREQRTNASQQPSTTKNYIMLRFKAGDTNKEKGCQFYKIEAWGGGEAAAITETGERRSGRPGQYVMGVLRNPNCTDTCNAFSEAVRQARNRNAVRDLEFSIEVEVGEGGKSNETKNVTAQRNTGTNSSGALDTAPNPGAGSDTVVKFCTCSGNNCSAVPLANPPGTSNNKKCYDIMSAAGGGSTSAGILNAEPIKDLMVSYRTITGDVLASDDGATKLLLEGRAMFTKFPLEMNFPLYDRTGLTRDLLNFGIEKALQGRSLSKQFCQWKDRYYTHRIPGDLFIPGMGGCWSEKHPDKPGLGESGAAMITCERWDDVAPTFLGNGIEEPSQQRPTRPQVPTTPQKPAVTRPAPAVPASKPAAPAGPAVPAPKKPSDTNNKCAGMPAGSCVVVNNQVQITYKYCPWHARWQISSWKDAYSCIGGIRTYTDTFASVQAYEQYRNTWMKVKKMHDCHDKSCVHFRVGYTETNKGTTTNRTQPPH